MMILLKRFIAYLKVIMQIITKNPGRVNKRDLFKYFPDWWSSLDPGRNPISDRRPWIAFAAIRYLESILTKNMHVYEYGSGGSTLFFAERVQEVISTEHNKDWYRQVLEEINRAGITNCHIRLFQPGPAASVKQDLSDPDAYISSDDNYPGMSFREYASSIDSYPDRYFDVIFIDGRSRPSCFKHAERKLKQGGYLILDNAETRYYSYIHKSLGNNKWNKIEFVGLFPYIYHYSETCIWQKIDTA